jgi:CRP-like cAMP-binding protein
MTIDDFIRENINGFQMKEITLPFAVEELQVEPKTILSAFGRLEDRMYFLKNGAIQVATRKGEEERILEFVFPGHFFCAYTSFLLAEPSDVEVSTLTKCEVSVIRKEDLIGAAESLPVVTQLCRRIAEQLFLSRARREKEFLTMSAEERYKALFLNAPEIIRLIPGIKIARYLGIQAESLSRIRKTIIP